MTIFEIFNRANTFKPSEWTNEQKLVWLNALEGEIYNDIVRTHENPDNITYESYTDESESVIAPDRYCDMYIYWLLMQTDLHNGDLTRYENDSMLYTEAYLNFARWYNRTHAPLQHVKIRY